ncbi:uncharacterized protein LOC131335551 isoform X2 [Rhododendron vialii]|uniref:uncharacterized protein LOC131335551 isoform X2 n=1 Tax=Rhododendron vialii TaxID=182163 RepID=UPI002660316B|nr:uncharacterized protein LOC131335551 isoform X2 [Rhododendron vialii]
MEIRFPKSKDFKSSSSLSLSLRIRPALTQLSHRLPQQPKTASAAAALPSLFFFLFLFSDYKNLSLSPCIFSTSLINSSGSIIIECSESFRQTEKPIANLKMGQSVKPISSPVPDEWYPTLAIFMLAIGRIVTTSFFRPRNYIIVKDS